MGLAVTYTQFIQEVYKTKGNRNEWRLGQTMYNVLHDINPKLADFVQGTSADPFYNDGNIAAFLTILQGYYLAFGSVIDERCSNL